MKNIASFFKWLKGFQSRVFASWFSLVFWVGAFGSGLLSFFPSVGPIFTWDWWGKLDSTFDWKGHLLKHPKKVTIAELPGFSFSNQFLFMNWTGKKEHQTNQHVNNIITQLSFNIRSIKKTNRAKPFAISSNVATWISCKNHHSKSYETNQWPYNIKGQNPRICPFFLAYKKNHIDQPFGGLNLNRLTRPRPRPTSNLRWSDFGAPRNGWSIRVDSLRARRRSIKRLNGIPVEKGDGPLPRVVVGVGVPIRSTFKRYVQHIGGPWLKHGGSFLLDRLDLV